ncbi:efflux transporter outer membrane subunit [Thiohalorhabdus sp.]|uniref:efflux transporter outer membrane subunit n=1 Tax=Thiohalorhabdus sp. TaxID=3094134 RepID=UPI002FC375DD
MPMTVAASSHPPHTARPLLAVLALALMAGCTTRGEQPEPPVELGLNFSEAGDAQPPERWWRAFSDSKLNALVGRALQANLDLKTAWQRLREARAVTNRQSAALFPSLEATAEVNTESGGASGATFDSDSFAQGGLSAAYEIDLWGRIRARTEAESLRARATHADYRAATLSLAAEVTRIWYRLAEARARRDLIAEQAATNEKVLALIETQFGHGQARSADLLRQRRLLESVRQQHHAAEAHLQTLEHQLAVLLGRRPQQGVDARRDSLPALPALPATGLPAELVQRRPDVRSAWLRLRAADREVAAAVSNQFPRLSLSASAVTTDRGAAQLYDDWALSFAANLAAPLIDAGRREAEVARTRAVERQRLFEYGQAVLTAFREAEDALIRERGQRRELASLREQVRLAAQSYSELRRRYLKGDAAYLDVLTALADTQALRRDLLAARMDLVAYRIALYRALAGGFRTEREADLARAGNRRPGPGAGPQPE